MAYDLVLAERLRNYLQAKNIFFTEKKMFGGLAFLVNDKMCVNVSGEKLMCRFDPEQQRLLESKLGFEQMIMKGKALKGYGYVNPIGYSTKKDFTFWVNTCLQFNYMIISKK